MAIMRWNPWAEMLDLSRRMNRLFENQTLSKGEGNEGNLSLYSWSPAVDIFETNEDIVVKAELPGMKKDDIDINIEDNILTIKGDRKQEKEIKSEDYYRIESSYGSFQRSFSLPKPIKSEAVKASYKDGILTIKVPKAEEAKPKKVQIDVK